MQTPVPVSLRSLHCVSPSLRGNALGKDSPLSMAGGRGGWWGRTIQGEFGNDDLSRTAFLVSSVASSQELHK